MSDRIVVPKFESESDEADWWFEHRQEHGAVMAEAMQHGTTSTMAKLLEQVLRNRKGV